MDRERPKPSVARRPDVLRKLNAESLQIIERGLIPEKLRPQVFIPVRGRSNELAVAKQSSFLTACLPVIPDSPISEVPPTFPEDESVSPLKKSFSFRDKFSRMSHMFGKEKDKEKTEKPKWRTIAEDEQKTDKHGNQGHSKYTDTKQKSPDKSEHHDHKNHKRAFWFFRNKELQEEKKKTPQRHSNIYVRSKSFEFLPRALEEEEKFEKPDKQKRRLKNSISFVFGSTDTLDDWISHDEPDYHPDVYYDNDDGVFLKDIKALPASESSNNSSMSIVTSNSSGIVVNMFKTQSVMDILNDFEKAVEMFSENYLSDSEPYTKSGEVLSASEKRKSSSFSTLPSPKVMQTKKASEISADFKVELSRVLSVKRKSVGVRTPTGRRGSVTDCFLLEDQAAAAAAASAAITSAAAFEANKYRRAQKKPANRVRRISSTKYVSRTFFRAYLIANFCSLNLYRPSLRLKR